MELRREPHRSVLAGRGVLGLFTRGVAILLASAAAAVLTVSLAFVVAGCGPAASEADQAAAYTPESVAQELAFRYRSLLPEAKKSGQKARPRSKPGKTTTELARDEKASTKASGGVVTKKRSGPPTIDDVLEDIGVKLSRITGMSRSEACKKVIEAISRDSSLSESDKNALTELAGRLAD